MGAGGAAATSSTPAAMRGEAARCSRTSAGAGSAKGEAARRSGPSAGGGSAQGPWWRGRGAGLRPCAATAEWGDAVVGALQHQAQLTHEALLVLQLGCFF